MFIRVKTSKKAKYPTMQIVEGVRDGKKVRQRTVAHLGVVKDKTDGKRLKALADGIMARLRKEGLDTSTPVDANNLKHQKTIRSGFRAVVDRLLVWAGVDQVLQQAQGKHRFNVQEVVHLLLAQRLFLPSSKLRTCERQEELGFRDIALHNIYRVMDVIAPLNEAIQQQAFKKASELSEGPVDCLFFDVTTLYFESVSKDDMKDFGFSKDQKHHSVQVVLALVVDYQGIPLAYEAFKGNTAETKTLIPVLENLKKRFSITNVVVVCDRGLASTTNVEALQASNMGFVIASKLRSMSKEFALNDLSKYEELPGQGQLAQEERIKVRVLPHPQYADTDLIITHSQARAQKDRSDRERLLEKLRDKMEGTKPEMSVKQVISNHGYKKFTTVEKGSKVSINKKAEEEDAKWDGFHGIAVSRNTQLSINQALSRYHDLWRIEETFRVAKTTLKTRPIFHWAPHRIKSHVLLCFITLLIERCLEVLLQKQGVILAPDRIRYAIDQVHTVYFTDPTTGVNGHFHSELTTEAQSIFRVLNLEVKDLASHMCCA